MAKISATLLRDRYGHENFYAHRFDKGVLDACSSTEREDLIRKVNNLFSSFNNRVYYVNNYEIMEQNSYDSWVKIDELCAVIMFVEERERQAFIDLWNSYPPASQQPIEWE